MVQWGGMGVVYEVGDCRRVSGEGGHTRLKAIRVKEWL